MKRDAKHEEGRRLRFVLDQASEEDAWILVEMIHECRRSLGWTLRERRGQVSAVPSWCEQPRTEVKRDSPEEEAERISIPLFLIAALFASCPRSARARSLN